MSPDRLDSGVQNPSRRRFLIASAVSAVAVVAGGASIAEGFNLILESEKIRDAADEEAEKIYPKSGITEFDIQNRIAVYENNAEQLVQSGNGDKIRDLRNENFQNTFTEVGIDSLRFDKARQIERSNGFLVKFFGGFGLLMGGSFAIAAPGLYLARGSKHTEPSSGVVDTRDVTTID